MAPVIVRYFDDAAFTADAATLTPLGYRVAARSSERAGLSIAGGVWMVVAALFTIGGFVSPVLWIVAVLFALLASTGRRRMLKVTYQQG
jgi:hypothetical protein